MSSMDFDVQIDRANVGRERAKKTMTNGHDDVEWCVTIDLCDYSFLKEYS